VKGSLRAVLIYGIIGGIIFAQWGAAGVALYATLSWLLIVAVIIVAIVESDRPPPGAPPRRRTTRPQPRAA
jgi:hypothetical protein